MLKGTVFKKIIRKTLSAALAVSMIAACGTATIGGILPFETQVMALQTSDGFSYYVNPDGESVTVTGYSGSSVSISIPSEINSMPVTIVERSGSSGTFASTDISSVYIPSSVKEIKSGSFWGVTSLKTLSLSTGQLTIGENAFQGCTGLEKLTFPSQIVKVGRAAFAGCTGLKTVVFKGNDTEIGDYAFGYKSNGTGFVGGVYQTIYIKTGQELYIYGENMSKAYIYCTRSSISFVVNPKADLQLESTNVKKGSSVSATMNVTDGAGGFTYDYYSTRSLFYPIDPSYTSNGTNPKICFTSLVSGRRRLVVRATDKHGVSVSESVIYNVYDPLVNTSTISADTINLGAQITLHCSSEGGYDTTEYAVFYKRHSESTWNKLRDYSTDTEIPYKSSFAGVIDIIIRAKNGGDIDDKNFSITVREPLMNLSTLSSEKIKLGESIKVSCKADGGVAPYMYAVTYKKTTDTDYATAQEMSSNTSVDVKPGKVADYEICVKVRDSVGNLDIKSFIVNVSTPDLKNTSKISAEKVTVGSDVTVTGSATGGKGTYKYAVFYKKTTDTKWATAQDFKANNKVTVKPGKVAKYDICVKVKDEAGTIDKKYFTVDSVKADDTALKNTSKISAEKVAVGTAVTVTGSATGGNGTYKYAVFFKKTTETSWATVQDFKANNTVTVKPGKVAKYDICVKVKDEAGTIDKKYFTVDSVKAEDAALKNTSKISAENVTVGTAVTVTGSATGGKGTYKYAVFFKKTTETSWATVQDFKANNTVTVKPGKVAKYDICVKVKDEAGTIDKKYFTVDSVKAEDAALKNTSKISAENVTVGTAVTVTGSATGGKGTYKYAVFFKKTTETSWATVQDFKANNTVTVKPGKVAKYDICVKVKDEAGTIDKKYFTVDSVKAEDAALKNTSKISADKVTVGSKVTVTGSATGGKGTYKYAVFFKKTTETSWATVQDFNVNNTLTVKPGKVAKYDICVKVKDEAGTIEKKYFTVDSVSS